MATLEEIVVQLTAETSQLRAELKGASDAVVKSSDKMDKALKDFADNSKKSTTFAQQAFASFTGFLGSQAVIGAFNFLKGAAGDAFGVLLDGIEDAKREEVALRQLATSMALAGTATETSTKELAEFAGRMEDIAGIGDDVVASNLAVLSSLTKLDSEGLQKAQQAAIDLSAALNIDLESATKLTAKAIEGNVAGLKKYGVEVQESANKTQQFANTMNALSQFSGSAEQKMKTFEGATTAVKNSFGNFVEEIAKSITGNEVLIAALGEVSNIFKELTTSAGNNGEALRTGIANAFLFISDAAIATIQVLDGFFRMMKSGIMALLLPLDVLVDSVNGVLSLFKDDTSGGRAFGATEDRWKALTETIEGDTTLSNVQGILERVRTAGASAFDQLGESASASAPKIKNIANQVQELSNLEKMVIENQKAFINGLLSAAASAEQSYAFRNAVLDQSLADELTTVSNYNETKNALLQEQFAAEWEALQQHKGTLFTTEQEYQAAVEQLRQQQYLKQVKLDSDNKKREEDLSKQKLADLKSTFGMIATLSESGNKELAAIGKAAAITNATIDGYAAVQKALAAAPPPFNFALAGLVGAATAANVAKIAGVGLRRGIDSVPGTGNTDNFPAVLAPGERVVPSETNKDLTEFLARAGAQERNVNININIVAQPGAFVGRETAADIVEGLNNYFSNGGIKLMGAM